MMADDQARRSSVGRLVRCWLDEIARPISVRPIHHEIHCDFRVCQHSINHVAARPPAPSEISDATQHKIAGRPQNPRGGKGNTSRPVSRLCRRPLRGTKSPQMTLFE
jgi:hypothetical protein